MSKDTITFQQGNMTLDFSNVNVPITVISGATGCGKTHLMGEIVDYLLHAYNNKGMFKIAEVNNTDAQKYLEYVLQEIDRRMELFARNGCSSVSEFFNSGSTVPQLIVVVDMHFVQEDEVKQLLLKIAKKAKAAGVHLIIASQYLNLKGVTDLGYWVQRVIFTSHNYGELGWDGVPQNNLGSCVVCVPSCIAC